MLLSILSTLPGKRGTATWADHARGYRVSLRTSVALCWSRRVAPGAKSGADGLELAVLGRLCYLQLSASVRTREPFVEVPMQVRQ